MIPRSAAAPGRLAAALLLLLCLAAALVPAAAVAAGAHERACGAAFGVLRQCAAMGGSQEGVHARCCSLLKAFQHNGCLCPDCPPGASADATSSKGLLLGAELSPLIDLCGIPLPATTATELGAPQLDQAEAAVGEQEEEDADDMMADMAGLAAAAQDPARAQLLARHSATAASAATRAAEERLQQQRRRRQEAEDSQLLLDTPEDDYDNLLSDADAAFMLVDPTAARSYASRATQLARGAAADVAAGLMAGRAAVVEMESELHNRLASLLTQGRAATSNAAQQQQRQAARPQAHAAQQREQQRLAGVGLELELEEVASASAVSDDSTAATAGSLPAGRAAARPAVLLARLDAVPQTAEHRRAAALATALERQQEHNLAQQAQQQAQQAQQAQQQRVGTAELRQQRRDIPGAQAAVVAQAAAGADYEAVGQATPLSHLSLDITIDADDPETARRVVSSIAAVLKSWQAAGSARTQAELAAALESTAAKVAAASGPLGRAGLQPRELLLQQVEEEGTEPPRMCACMGMELASADGPAPDLATAAHRRYLAVRLALCRFACQHQQTLAILLVAELALTVAWLAIWLLRSRQQVTEDAYAEGGCCDGQPYFHYDHACPAHFQSASQHQPMPPQQQQQPQFLIASAADPQWQAELKQPLLQRGQPAGSSSSSSC